MGIDSGDNNSVEAAKQHEAEMAWERRIQDKMDGIKDNTGEYRSDKEIRAQAEEELFEEEELERQDKAEAEAESDRNDFIEKYGVDQNRLNYLLNNEIISLRLTGEPRYQVEDYHVRSFVLERLKKNKADGISESFSSVVNKSIDELQNKIRENRDREFQEKQKIENLRADLGINQPEEET